MTSSTADRLESLDGESAKKGVAVVTGGSAGLGRATVRAFAAAGYDVAVLARGEDGLAGAVADVAGAGRRALGLAVDVADHRAVDAAAAQVEDRMGPIEVWVNNAMTSIFAPFMDTDPEDFERATAVTYFGFVNGTRAALRRMKPRDRGVLVQVGSALAYRGIPLQAAYCGSKHAMVGFTESVITELCVLMTLRPESMPEAIQSSSVPRPPWAWNSALADGLSASLRSFTTRRAVSMLLMMSICVCMKPMRSRGLAIVPARDCSSRLSTSSETLAS